MDQTTVDGGVEICDFSAIHFTTAFLVINAITKFRKIGSMLLTPVARKDNIADAADRYAEVPPKLNSALASV
jgi:hypothetical protein